MLMLNMGGSIEFFLTHSPATRNSADLCVA